MPQPVCYRTVTFTVPTIPIAQPRQRHRVVTAHGRTFATNYTPKNSPVNAFKAAVQHAAFAEFRDAPHDGPARLSVVFVFPRPAGMCWKKKPMPRARHCGRPDADNVYKALVDALSGLVISDDGRIYRAEIEKWIAAGDEQPHCEVTIELEPW